MFLNKFRDRGSFLSLFFCSVMDEVTIPLNIVRTPRRQDVQNDHSVDTGRASIDIVSKSPPSLEYDNTHIIYQSKAVVQEAQIVPSGTMRTCK